MIAEIHLGELEQGRRLVAQGGQPAPPCARRADSRGHVQQLFGAQHTAHAGTLGERPHVVHAAQVQAWSESWQEQGLTRGRQPTPGLVKLTGRQQG